MTKIILVRIRGMVNVDFRIETTLDLLRLRKKFSCVLIENKKEYLGMITKAKDYIAYDNVDLETLKLLLLKRARLPGNKNPNFDEKTAEENAKKLMENKITLEELKLKPFFMLHPPRGGFKGTTKQSWPKGVLGKNKDLNKLIKKML